MGDSATTEPLTVIVAADLPKIPTLSEWGLIALALMLALAALKMRMQRSSPRGKTNVARSRGLATFSLRDGAPFRESS